MENIKFINEIMKHGTRSGKPFGDCLFYKLKNGNLAKCFVDGGGIYGESLGVYCVIANKNVGEIQKCYFPFENYFDKVCCSPNAPKWTPHIDRGKWYFSQYPHCLPKTSDYKRMANAVCEFMGLFE